MEHTELLRQALPPLTDWFRANRRALPWRADRNPYHVWISEIMLQQTRIEAVIPYYERFLTRLPNVEALADAPEDELLKLWEGLGYYSRARNLKKAAQMVMEQYGGRIPHTAAELRALPGIGDYTAGAIASIACGQPEPAVDGNVLRVLSRLTETADDVMDMTVRKETTRALREIYPDGEEAGMVTQGLMELGEVICIPNGRPLCEDCPWHGLCLAEAHGTQDRYPVRSARKERRREEMTVLLLQKGGRYALCRRPASGLLAGMWQFPNVPGQLTEQEVQQTVETLGLQAVDCRRAGQGRHAFTHVEWHMTGWLVMTAEAGDTPDNGMSWFTPEEIERKVALPTAFRCWKNRLV